MNQRKVEAMKKNLSSIILWVSLLMPVQGQLPSFEKAPLFGFFAIHEHERYTLKINEEAVISILPHMGPKGEAPAYYGISQEIGFLETMKNGRVRKRVILPESLTTKDEKSTSFSHVTIEGEATGKIRFRYAITDKKGELTLQPEVLNPEELAGRDIKMVIQTRMGARYKMPDTLDGKAKEQTIENIDETTVTFHPKKESKAKKVSVTYAEVINKDACEKINGEDGFREIVTQGYFKHRTMCNFSLESEGESAALFLEHVGRVSDSPLHRVHAFQWIVNIAEKPGERCLLRMTLEED